MTRSEKAAADNNQQQLQPTLYNDTPDDLFVVEKTYSEAEADLIKFVEKHIDLMNSNLLFSGNQSPSFMELQKALMDYESVSLGLISLHAESRIKFALEQEKYDDFYSQKFCEVKNDYSTLEKSSMKTATKEIDQVLRKKYMKELAALRVNVIKAENEYNLFNHLEESWKNYQYVLGTMSRNAQAEAGAFKISQDNPKEFGDETN